MSQESFLPKEGGRRVIESNADTASPLRLCTSGDRRAPLTAPADKAWAVAFEINVVITVVSAMLAVATRSIAAGDTRELKDAAEAICISFVVLGPLAYALSKCILRAMSTGSRKFLQIAFVAFAVSSLVLMAWALAKREFVAALVTALVLAGVANVFFRHGRVGFASANLKVATLAVRATPNLFLWSICVSTIRFLWLIATGLALAGSVAAFQTVRGPDGSTYSGANCGTIFGDAMEAVSCECDGNVVSEDSRCVYSHRLLEMLLAFFWMSSMGWGFVVCTNIMTATAARSVALWWSSPDEVESAWRSCQVVMSSSFGPLCKAAATDGVVQLLNEVVQRLPPLFGGMVCRSVTLPWDDSSLFQLTEFYRNPLPKPTYLYLSQPLGLVFGLPLFLVKLVTSYAIGYTTVFIGMYRLGFTEASGRTKELFRTFGRTLLINEVVVGVCLLSAGLGPVLITYWYILNVLPEGEWGWTLILMLGVIVYGAFAVLLLPMAEVVLCAYKAVFVCFVQDPEALASHHDGLSREWQKLEVPSPTRRVANGGFELLQEV